jgi:hypothetical protein
VLFFAVYSVQKSRNGQCVTCVELFFLFVLSAGLSCRNWRVRFQHWKIYGRNVAPWYVHVSPYCFIRDVTAYVVVVTWSCCALLVSVCAALFIVIHPLLCLDLVCIHVSVVFWFQKFACCTITSSCLHFEIRVRHWCWLSVEFFYDMDYGKFRKKRKK